MRFDAARRREVFYQRQDGRMLDSRRDDLVTAVLIVEADRMAALSDQCRLVKTILVEGRAEQRLQALRACFTAPATSLPKAWADEAFPNCSEKYGSMAATTAGSARVVALLSR
jgi:hypothetical protein